MYSEKFQKSLAAVEAAREKNIALEPARMTAQQKTDLLAEYHPDYKQDEFELLQIGPNKGDKVPKELAATLQAHSRICPCCVDLENPDYDVDVLVIGGGGAGSSAAI
ncbi:MAG: succinate dehydrogenase/fumarate reductase flavoprotein subunit, partial [Clostridia bacterium]|nr:succinate dehydrogenase/fumarate reductase flavoprotein subunit [Clostridia bacterium]